MSAALAHPPHLPAAQPAHWLSQAEVLALTGWTDRWLRAKTNTGEVVSKPAPQKGANGKPQRLYLAASLPAEAQEKLAPASGPTASQSNLQTAPLFPAIATEEATRLSLPAEAERDARKRLALIQPLLDYTEHAARYAALQLQDGRKVKTARLLADYLAETQPLDGKPVSRATLWRWVKAFRAGGLPALARKPRQDQGSSHFFTRYPAAAVLVAAEYHKPYATVARAFDAIYRDQQLLCIPDDVMPSYECVRRFLDSLPKPLAILARQGQKAYTDKCSPHVARGYTDIAVNSTWVADHMIHDVEVRNDCFTGVATNAPMRLQLTAIMDMRSRKLLGPVWTVTGDSRSILTGFRRAVERFGPPATFYCDNGRDYKKATRRQQPLSEEKVRAAADELARRGAIQRLGVSVQYCIPYHPQSKPIERAFRTLHTRLDAMMPHYTTGNAYTRPDQTTLAGNEHRKLLKMGLGHESSLMPASLFIRLAETWIEQVYNATHTHSGKGMDGRTPNQVFDEGYPLAARRQADPEILGSLLYERRSVKVLRTAVTIEGRRYMPLQSSPESWAALHNENERYVVVAYDPLDLDRAIVLDARDTKIADLQAEQLATHSPASAIQVGEMLQTGRRLLKATVGTVKQIHRTVALAGHKSDLQHLAALAQISVPVEELVSQRMVRAATKPNERAHAPASSFDIANDILGELLA